MQVPLCTLLNHSQPQTRPSLSSSSPAPELTPPITSSPLRFISTVHPHFVLATRPPPRALPQTPTRPQCLKFGTHSTLLILLGTGLAASLSKFQDRVQIFLAVLFWMSLFFWASAWDGRDRPNKGSRFRR
uniref:Uncharacterized protein n=1 Tax=Quercus lobata TaxID=97700 RepID=A0A7N2LMR0_QUELO